MNKISENLAVNVLVALTLLFSMNQASAAGKIYYGSRAGMQVTIVSMEGLDSSSAVIKTRHTREDATAFCSEYVGKVSEECIKAELETRLNDQVVADCLRGVFTNFWGDKIKFRGPRTEVYPRQYAVWGKSLTVQAQAITRQTWEFSRHFVQGLRHTNRDWSFGGGTVIASFAFAQQRSKCGYHQ
jgi:hypothetical protein